MSRSRWIEDNKGKIDPRNGKPKGGLRYRARYRTPDQKMRSKRFATKVEAERWLDLQMASMTKGDWVDPNEGKVSFAVYAAEVQKGRVHLAPTTRARDDSYLRNLVLPHLGDLQLARIRPTHLRQMVASLSADGKAAATVRKAYQIANLILNQAVLDDKIVRTPARGIKLPSLRDSESEIRFLTADEVAQLHEAIDPRYRVAVSLGAYAGLRMGEVLGLQVTNFEPLRRRLTVTHSLTNLNGSVWLGPTKTKGSRRTISLPQTLVEELAAHLAEFATGPEGVVVSSPQGSWVRASSWRQRYWNPGVEASVGRPFRFHDLRHTHAAFLIAQGAHAKAIQTRLGHSSIVVTMDTYGHLLDGLDEELAEGLDALATAQRDRNLTATAHA